MSFLGFVQSLKGIRWWVDTIVFSGGEPLLNKNLGVMLTYARDYGIKTIVATNAQFLEGRLDSLIMDPPDKLIVAYEPPSKGFKDQSDNIRFLKEARVSGKPEIILRMVVTKKNVHKIDEFKKIANEIADSWDLKSLG
ncbi:unnamed protein product, partial [marine sediment metagenome]